MARVFVTGSSTGLGLMTGQLLAEQGHAVVLHGRDEQRSDEVLRALPDAEGAVTGDLSTICGMRSVAEQANALGRFDAVIHNAGVGYREAKRNETEDGVPLVFAVNVLAPYVLTALIERPDRLVYVSSGMHHGADANLDDLLWTRRRWAGSTAYAESKLLDVLLAFAAARRWPDVVSTALEPGWVPTRMGGAGARDDMDQAHRTQAWLAVSDDDGMRKTGAGGTGAGAAGAGAAGAGETGAGATGEYFFHLRPKAPNPQARDGKLQDGLIEACERISSVRWPT